MPPSTTSKAIAGLSFALGALALYKTQVIALPMCGPWLEACISKSFSKDTMTDFVNQTGYQPYDPRVGVVVFEPMVCVLTQFLYELVQHHPTGLLSWGITVVIFPAYIPLWLEAGRQGNQGLLLWPSAVWLGFQIFGISVVYPLVWVPAYCIWGGSEGGAVSLTRARLVFLVSLTMPILTLLVFGVLDSDNSPMWATCAGILGGPMSVLPGLLLAFDKPPPKTAPIEDAIRSAETSALSYAMAGIVSLLGYFYLAYIALLHYGLNFTEILNDLWFEAPHPSVQFMMVDAGFWYLGIVLHIGSRNLQRMVEALLCTPFFGPGAACAMALASIEMDASPQWTERDQDKKET